MVRQRARAHCDSPHTFHCTDHSYSRSFIRLIFKYERSTATPDRPQGSRRMCVYCLIVDRYLYQQFKYFFFGKVFYDSRISAASWHFSENIGGEDWPGQQPGTGMDHCVRGRGLLLLVLLHLADNSPELSEPSPSQHQHRVPTELRITGYSVCWELNQYSLYLWYYTKVTENRKHHRRQTQFFDLWPTLIWLSHKVKKNTSSKTSRC